MYELEHNLTAAAERFGVSVELMRWRWHKTGAALQVKRAQKGARPSTK
jgi:hypothetical protein